MRALNIAVPAFVALLACESTSGPVVVYERTVTPQMVTGAALAALTSEGRFVMQLPPSVAGQLLLADAKTQTLQFARYVTNNGLLRGVVESGRRGYWTDPHLLTLCDDVYYVHSQFGPIAHDSVGEPGLSYLKRLGPQWVIALCGSANEPQMTVQVAIEGNDIRFANGEPIEPYAFLSSAWNARGVPLNWPDALTISPERAVRFVYETFGVRVTKVPQLLVRGDYLPDGQMTTFPVGGARSCHRWRVPLESNVNVRGSTSLRSASTNVLFVAALSCDGRDVDPFIHLPLSEQPATTTLQYVDDTGSAPKTWAVTIPFMFPVRFEIGFRAP